MKTRNSTVWIDGGLYFITALFAGFMTYISTEEAYKYINPIALFWLKSIVGSVVTGANALKAYRSMTFSRHGNEQTPPSTP